MTWFYMSFVDPERPAGDRFVGGCYVRGESMSDALTRSWRLGINPGGEVQITKLNIVARVATEGEGIAWDVQAGQVCLTTDRFDELVPEGDRERLLSREEVEAS